MKKKISELLCNTRPPKRYEKVAQAYNEIAYGKAEDKDSTFKITSAYFIEKYDKEMCRKLESSACVNFSDKQADTIRRITQQLATPVQVQSCIIRPEFAPCPILPQPSITLTQPLGRLANVSASFNVSSSTTIRKCRHCGLPKSKMVGQVSSILLVKRRQPETGTDFAFNRKRVRYTLVHVASSQYTHYHTHIVFPKATLSTNDSKFSNGAFSRHSKFFQWCI